MLKPRVILILPRSIAFSAKNYQYVNNKMQTDYERGIN
jgi:hypothetical protein